MIEPEVAGDPVPGKTYSLFGAAADTDQYYTLISELADACLRRCPDIRQLIAQVQKAGKKKRFLKRRLRENPDRSIISFILNNAKDLLSPYTIKVNSHLKELPTSKLRDDILLTTEEQYHLYMLEIELVNRAFAESFNLCDIKLAFLPHCLRDLNAKCRAKTKPGDIDYTCQGCSRKCYINSVSALLKAHGIVPYIWMEADLKALFKKLKANGDSAGVLGIACIPELADGIRLCMKFDIPVVGVPLSANRCGRWMGEFYPTSVSVKELSRLLNARGEAINY